MFQYPLADRRACGMLTSFDTLVHASFSILLRIVELAGRPHSRPGRRHKFQYPLADRRACGTMPQQGAWRKQGFSILLRIVELAGYCAAYDGSAPGFQYPLADRRACGIQPACSEGHKAQFQYPLADRRACGITWKTCTARLECFSILLRIVELAADDLHPDRSTYLFQYPLADRRACGLRVPPALPTLPVSVSSCGS